MSCIVALTAVLAVEQAGHCEDPVFSGPQVGERLPSFKVNSLLGETAEQELDLIEMADGRPVLLVFFHARTRPAFGLTNTLMRYAATKEPGEISRPSAWIVIRTFTASGSAKNAATVTTTKAGAYARFGEPQAK